MQDETLRQKSIKYVGWGIANLINGRLYMHHKLKNREYRTLRARIIDHEKGHDPGNSYTLWDLIHDNKHSTLDLDLIFFIISTPSSWLQFSPLIYYDRQLIFDRQTTYLYTLMTLAALTGWILF